MAPKPPTLPDDPIARRLQLFRQEHDLTIPQLCAWLERQGCAFPYRTVQDWMAGRRRPSRLAMAWLSQLNWKL